MQITKYSYTNLFNRVITIPIGPGIKVLQFQPNETIELDANEAIKYRSGLSRLVASHILSFKIITTENSLENKNTNDTSNTLKSDNKVVLNNVSDAISNDTIISNNEVSSDNISSNTSNNLLANSEIAADNNITEINTNESSNENQQQPRRRRRRHNSSEEQSSESNEDNKMSTDNKEITESENN